jgi:3-deoxy-D-manno-octulosonic acid kinase
VYADFQQDWFDHARLSQVAKTAEWRSGRHAIARFSIGNHHLVLRHYYRGGLVARLTKDQFVFNGFEASRPFKEMKLLQYMQKMELPVPQAIAARCIKNGAFYRADILMSEIANTKTLMQSITQEVLKSELWVKVGQVIARFHQHGIHHVDLNANNILIDQAENIYLIDFDRCQQRSFSQAWANAELKRLKRSLNKQMDVNAVINFQPINFDNLMCGYQACFSSNSNTIS